MNIRMDSKEIRFRLTQEEVGHLLEFGSLDEKILLPLDHLNFRVQFGDSTCVVQFEHNITFWLSPISIEKLRLSNFDHEPVETLYKEFNGAKVSYKLEVDVFNSKQRGRQK